MKRGFWVFGVVIMFFLSWVSLVWAFPVSPVGVYWDLQVSYGSGNATIDQDSSTYLTPSLPHTYTVSRTEALDIYDDDGYFEAYAMYDADETSLTAEALGFADPDYSDDNDWYYALAKVAIGSNPFSGAPLFTLSFDWEYDLYISDNSQGQVAYAVGLIDWTATTDPENPVFVHAEKKFFYDTGSGSGHYENSWVLDPTHEYIFGVGVLALAKGYEDDDGADGYIEITNLKANAVPEPASIFLVGAGGLLVGFYRKRKTNRNKT